MRLIHQDRGCELDGAERLRCGAPFAIVLFQMPVLFLQVELVRLLRCISIGFQGAMYFQVVETSCSAMERLRPTE